MFYTMVFGVGKITCFVIFHDEVIVFCVSLSRKLCVKTSGSWLKVFSINTFVGFHIREFQWQR